MITTASTFRAASEFPSGEPGIYGCLPDDIYHGSGRCSYSKLKLMADRSPAHVRYALENQQETTPAMAFGSAAHMAILEPDRFDRVYTVAGACSATKKDGQPCGNSGVVCIDRNWYCGVHRKGVTGEPDTRQVLSGDDYEDCVCMRHEVWHHPVAAALMHMFRWNEVSVIGDLDGLAVQARFDAWATEHGILVDYKTTEDASEAAFSRAIYNYRYYWQAALYLHLAREYAPVDHYVLIAQEKKPPFAVGVYRIKDDLMYLGWRELQPVIARYRECVNSNRWPGYCAAGAKDIGVPEWAEKRIEKGLVQ